MNKRAKTKYLNNNEVEFDSNECHDNFLSSYQNPMTSNFFASGSSPLVAAITAAQSARNYQSNPFNPIVNIIQRQSHNNSGMNDQIQCKSEPLQANKSSYINIVTILDF
jgi:hypothetical protein